MSDTYKSIMEAQMLSSSEEEIERLEARVAKLENPKPCVWRNYPDSRGREEWSPACDTGPWQFTFDYEPDWIKFCPGCGKPVEVSDE